MLLLNEKPGVTDMCVPGKLTSYFAAGRPVLAATDPRSGAAAEVTASSAGALVPSGDPILMLKSVLAVADDPARAAEMGERGRAYAEAVLSPDHAIGAYTAWALGLIRAKRGSDAGTISGPGLDPGAPPAEDVLTGSVSPSPVPLGEVSGRP